MEDMSTIKPEAQQGLQPVPEELNLLNADAAGESCCGGGSCSAG